MPYTEEELQTNKQCYDTSAEQYFDNTEKYSGTDGMLLGYFLYLMKKNSPTPKVFELGVGTARRALFMKKENVEVLAIDFCRKFVNNANSNGIKCIYGEFLSSDLSEYRRWFNGVHCASFLHFFKPDDIDEALHKIRNLLLSGGFLYIDEPVEDISAGWCKITKTTNGISERYKTILTVEEWLKLIEESGFKKLSMIYEYSPFDKKLWFSGVWRKI
jgi:ubiquinone/menaquinone biosynthesis C-methylase UbiE